VAEGRGKKREGDVAKIKSRDLRGLFLGSQREKGWHLLCSKDNKLFSPRKRELWKIFFLMVSNVKNRQQNKL
jgi:hypothetical protein